MRPLPGPNLRFDPVAFIPWTEAGFREDIVYASILGIDGPIMLCRRPPNLTRGPEGSLWLTSNERVMRLHQGHPATVFSAATKLVDIAPTLDRGLVVLGQVEGEYILACLTEAGQRVWSRTDTPILQSNPKCVQLVVDFDGVVYLYAAGPGGSYVVRVNLQNGDTESVLSLEGYLFGTVGVCGGMFWIAYRQDGYYWMRYNLSTGEQRTLTTCSYLQGAYTEIVAPLPDGGALVSLLGTYRLTWMDPDGEFRRGLYLAGVVRVPGGLATAIQEGDHIIVSRREGGRSRDVFRAGPFSNQTILIHATSDHYFLRDGENLVILDTMGKRLSETPWDRVEAELRRWGGYLNVNRVAVEPDGAILLSGADAEGIYIARLIVESA